MTPSAALFGLLGIGVIAAASGSSARAPGARGPALGWSPYLELCARWARAWGLPVSILAVVGMIESGRHPTMVENTDPRAVSRGGSWGLFGMTFKTAEHLISDPAIKALPASRRWDGTPTALHDPELAAMLAGFYLAHFWRKFHAFLPTVAAYQQGSLPVSAVLERGGNLVTDLPPHGREYAARALEALGELQAGGRA